MGSIAVRVETADQAFGSALAVYLATDPTLEVTSQEAEVVVVSFQGRSSRSQVASASAESLVLALGDPQPDELILALEAGAFGFWDRSAPFEQIAMAVRSVGEGQGVVPPALLGSLLRHAIRRRRAEREDLERLESLTSREREVFECAAAGLDRSTIAADLFISTDTVRTHLQRVFRKLDVHSRAEAVAFAARCGLDVTRRGDG